MLFFTKLKSHIIALLISILILPGCAEYIALEAGIMAVNALDDLRKKKKEKSEKNTKTTKSKTVIAKKSCDEAPKSCSNVQLCKIAATGNKWETRSHFASYVKEAKRRGYTCGVKHIPKSCPQDIKVCSNKIICIGATSLKNNISISNPLYVYKIEANRRNLKCN